MKMNGGRARLPRLRLTLRQMMKLVIFAAIASASVAPIARLKKLGVTPNWSAVCGWGAVVVPLVSALVAFPLVRKGPLKDWLIRALLMTSVTVTLGFAIYLLASIYNLSVSRGVPLDYRFLTATAGVVFVLGGALIFLLWRVIPGWCPDCKSPMLIPDVSIRSLPGSAPAQAYRCLTCDGRYQKLDGTWRLLPPDPVPRRQELADHC
jgi:uncharacterized membrane protein YqjE